MKIRQIIDTPLLAAGFFIIEEVNSNYVLAGADKQKKVQELLIMNYEPNSD